jgi:hypothetical protein
VIKVSQECGAKSLGLEKFSLQHVSKQGERERENRAFRTYSPNEEFSILGFPLQIPISHAYQEG